MAIPEVFLPYQEDGSETFKKSFNDGYTDRVTESFLTALEVNALQVQRYLTTYAQHSGDFPLDTFNSLQKKLGRALNLHKYLAERGDVEPSQEELSDVAAVYVDYMKEVKRMCQSVWAKFDNVSITEGLVLLLLSVVMVPVMLMEVHIGAQTLRKVLPYGAACGMGLTLAISLFLNVTHLELSFSGIVSLTLTLLLYSLTATVAIFLLLSSLAIFDHFLSAVNNLHVSVLQLLSIAVTLLYGVAMLSNSFVLYEGDMVAFFLQSLIICFAVRSLQLEFKNETNPRFNKATLVRMARTIAPHIGVMACIRTVKIFYACRDLQIQDGCLATTFIHALPVVSEFLGWLAKWRLVLSCVALLSVPIAMVCLVRQNTGSRHLNQWVHYVVRFGFPFAVVCVSGFWALLCLPLEDLEALSPWQHVTLPRLVYLVSTVAMTLCVIGPFKRSARVLTMNCEENPGDIDNDNVEDVDRERDTVSESGTQRARLRKQKMSKEETIVSSSRMNAIGRSLHPSLVAVIPLADLILLVSLWIPVALLLNDGIALSAVVMATQVALMIYSLRGKESGTYVQSATLHIRYSILYMCGALYILHIHVPHLALKASRFRIGSRR